MAKHTKPTPSSENESGELIKSRTEENLDVLVGQLESALPQQFSSRYDGGNNPDDDFIDLDALERNITDECLKEY